jgi:hypothetical protein
MLSWASCSYQDCLDRGMLLTRKLLNQVSYCLSWSHHLESFIVTNPPVHAKTLFTARYLYLYKTLFTHILLYLVHTKTSLTTKHLHTKKTGGDVAPFQLIIPFTSIASLWSCSKILCVLSGDATNTNFVVCGSQQMMTNKYTIIWSSIKQVSTSLVLIVGLDCKIFVHAFRFRNLQ